MIENRPVELIRLLKIEKEEDYRQYQTKMLQADVQSRVREGMTWYPVTLIKDFIGVGERVTIEIQRKASNEQRHAFQVGSNVGIFLGEDEDKYVSGVISYIRDREMRIVLNGDLPEWLDGNRLGVNLLFDDLTYREMNRAIKKVADASNDRIAELRDIFYGLAKGSQASYHQLTFPSLNEKQNEAINTLLQEQDIGFVHGPPGTGKTTTMVLAIKEVVQQEKQVLVCAPSNAAVDLLVEKLVAQDLNVLRIGHPARLTPEVVENGLDARISRHQYFTDLKETRRKSEQLRKEALKFKRKYGATQKMQRQQLMRESKFLKAESKRLEFYITESLLDQAQVIACSLTGANNVLIKERLFKTVFIDEATQCMEPACWIPILKANRVFMSGDHFQLPPTVKSHQAAKAGLETTLFEIGIENTPEFSKMLEVQYRMREEIMHFSNTHFYQGHLKVAPDIMTRPTHYTEPVLFIDTAGMGYAEEVKKETLSTFNQGEATLLMAHLSAELIPGKSVGVIAPYKAQIELLRTEAHRKKELAHLMEDITINTVDAFQGQERDVIYISLVRSNDTGEIGFLKEYRRLNVAMTRARERLVMIGDSATLSHDAFFNNLIGYFQERSMYKSGFELGSWG